MAYYDALKAKWAQAPAGTEAEKLTWINAQTVTGPPRSMKAIPSTEIYNRTDRAEYKALVAADESVVQRNLAPATVDFSPSSAMRTLWLSLFPAGSKTQTNLKPYTDSFDVPKIPWSTAPVASGGGGLNGPVSHNDLVAAGIVP
jgi:hypothetical protein